MMTIEETTGMCPSPAFQATCDRVAQGIPFSREEQDAAMKRMELIREAIRKAHGIQDIAVELIRESRDSR